jgi:hypothetical protein
MTELLFLRRRFFRSIWCYAFSLRIYRFIVFRQNRDLSSHQLAFFHSADQNQTFRDNDHASMVHGGIGCLRGDRLPLIGTEIKIERHRRWFGRINKSSGPSQSRRLRSGIVLSPDAAAVCSTEFARDGDGQFYPSNIRRTPRNEIDCRP